MTSPSAFFLTPWVRRLLVANAVVYLLTVTVFTGPWFMNAVAFSPAGAADRPWTFGPYLFMHSGLLHLAVNMLMLLMFGPSVERQMGSAPFFRFYLLCGMGAPAVAFMMSLFTGVAPFVGASAAVFGVALAFAMRWPQARIFMFPLPWPVPVKALVAVLAAMDLAPLVLDPVGGLAQFAHLGGFLLGYAYLKGERLMDRRAAVAVERQSEAPVLVAHQQPAAESADRPPPAPAQRAPAAAEDDVEREMDRLLDKISQHGMTSLTAAERRFLDETSRRMRRR
jgi:membrane associated rhomboid family serine protease